MDVATTPQSLAFRPGGVRALSDLRSQIVYKPEEMRRAAFAELSDFVGATLGPRLNLGTLELDLTARHPHADAGLMDFYAPGRWDCTYDLVYMMSIHQVGPSVGEWEGTVGYARFKAPAEAAYIVVVNFSGYEQTMGLYGPWGVTTAYSATTSDSPSTVALWNGTAGQDLYCEFSSRSNDGYSGIAYLNSFQVFTAA
jgi:hypothetical protein